MKLRNLTLTAALVSTSCNTDQTIQTTYNGFCVEINLEEFRTMVISEKKNGEDSFIRTMNTNVQRPGGVQSIYCHFDPTSRLRSIANYDSLEHIYNVCTLNYFAQEAAEE